MPFPMVYDEFLEPAPRMATEVEIRLRAEATKLEKEKNELIAAVGEHVTVRSELRHRVEQLELHRMEEPSRFEARHILMQQELYKFAKHATECYNAWMNAREREDKLRAMLENCIRMLNGQISMVVEVPKEKANG